MIESRPGTEISSRASGRHNDRCGQYGSGPKPTSTQQSLHEDSCFVKYRSGPLTLCTF